MEKGKQEEGSKGNVGGHGEWKARREEGREKEEDKKGNRIRGGRTGK